MGTCFGGLHLFFIFFRRCGLREHPRQMNTSDERRAARSGKGVRWADDSNAALEEATFVEKWIGDDLRQSALAERVTGVEHSARARPSRRPKVEATLPMDSTGFHYN